MMDYSCANYWNERYAKTTGTQMEWYCGFDHLDDIFELYLKNNKFDPIVMIGCGKSMLQHDLINIGGYFDVIGIDISETVMNQRHHRNRCMEGIVMNALNLSFTQGSIKCFIDKGALDAIICDENVAKNDALNTMLSQVYKCLCFNGIYILISMHNEEVMIPKLMKYKNIKWDIVHHMVSYSWQSLFIRELKSLKENNSKNNLSAEAMKTMAMNKTFEMLQNVNFDDEQYKNPDTSKVCHIYACIKAASN